MASKYWEWKFRDVKPEVKRELTPAEKRKNWWDYHLWHVVTGVVLVLIAGGLLWDALRGGTVKPDYLAAYVGENPLPDTTALALETALASLGEDLNGDGQVSVELRQYASGGGNNRQIAMAAALKLNADLEAGESYFFLMDDPESFQRQYGALCYLDGSLPPDNDCSVEHSCLRWSDCPALASLDLGDYSCQAAGGTAEGDSQELLSTLYIGRRGFWTEKSAGYAEGCAALWEIMTAGANP